MSILVNAADECFFIYEGAGVGHVLPPYNGPWTLLGEYVYNTDVNQNTIVVTRYPDLTPSGWAGVYLGSNGSDLYLEANPGSGAVQAPPLVLTPGTRYPASLHYNPTTQILAWKIDGVVVRQLTGVVLPPGTTGQLSAQWAGFGAGGHTDSTWARWRMWAADLTEAECKAEHRSYTPVRTADLVSNWPMLPGSVRYDDTVGPNFLIPNGSLSDGANIPLLPLAGGVSETLTLTDSVTGAHKRVGTVSETITFVDSVVGYRKSAATVTEAIVLSDSVASVWKTAGAVVESLTFVDSVSAAASGMTGEITESIAFTDSVVSTWSPAASVAETITFVDSVIGNWKSSEAISETLTLSDTISAVREYTALVEESITFADSVTGNWRTTASLVETITFTDSVTSTKKSTDTVVESITLVDSVRADAPGEAGITETITFTDIIAGVWKGSAEIVESLQFEDVVEASTRPLPPIIQINGADPGPEDFRKDKKDLRDQIEAAVRAFDKKAEKAIDTVAKDQTQVIQALQAKQAIIDDIQITQESLDQLRASLERNLTQVFSELMRHEEVARRKKAEKIRRRRNDEMMLLF